MKALVVALLTAGLCASIHADTLITRDGASYADMTIKRIDPDGLLVEYSLPGNGLGFSKIKFTRLSDDQQKQYGYDAAKARDFETQCTKATEDWRANALRMESEARIARTEREAQDQSAQTQRIIAMAQLKQAEADLARTSGSAGYGGYDEGGGWGGYGIPGIYAGRVPRATRTLAPIVTPVPWPRINSPISSGQGRR